MRHCDERCHRRTFLRGIGVSLLGAGFAGCATPGGDEDDEEDSDGNGEDDGGEEGDGDDEEGNERLTRPDVS